MVPSIRLAGSAILLLCWLPALVVAADDPHDPQHELKSFKLLDGFEANLFADESLGVVNPIHMTWDPAGRLWMVCSPTYPHLVPGQQPNDQIVVVEDTNGDGRADKSTVFAEGLYVPTGLELGDGGVYVANAPQLLFLKDTDGDGRADTRRVVLSGFGTEDSHHSISAWRWGPGGWLYFQEGTFHHSQVETSRGPVRLSYGGVFQYKPRRDELRVYADYQASNPWGHTFDRWGNSILIDNPRIFFLSPLTANSRAKLNFEPVAVGSTKHCGGEIVESRHLPAAMQGELWTNQYKAHTVARYRVEESGSAVNITPQPPVLVSSSEFFRPVDLKTGPDGAVYVLDWYNPLIGHMQHSLRDERRDHAHGRVWRIAHRQRPLVDRPRITGAPIAKVLDYLKSTESWARNQAKRELYDRPAKEVVAALPDWLAALDAEDPDFEHHRLEALWVCQTIGHVDANLLQAVLKSPEPRARAAAVRVLRYWHDRIDDPLPLLATAIADDHPRVRMEAVLTLGYVPDPQSVVIAARALDKPMDRHIEHALKLTVDGLQDAWLPAHRAGQIRFDRPAHREYTLGNLFSSESIATLESMLGTGQYNPTRMEIPLDTVARRATAKQLGPLISAMNEASRDGGAIPAGPHAALLESLETAARLRDVRPPGKLQLVIRRALRSNQPGVQVAAARLAGSWKLVSEVKLLTAKARDTKAPLELRLAAATALGNLGDKQRKQLRQLAKDGPTTADRYVGVVGLVPGDQQQAAQLAADALALAPQDADPAVVVEAFLARKSGADTLAQALKKTAPHPQAAQQMAHYMDRVGAQHAALVAILSPERPEVLAKLQATDAKALAAAAAEHGDAARGEAIFRRRALNCTACHGFAGSGPKVGPDLATVGSGSQGDYIVDALLRPSKVIKEFYDSATVLTVDGRVVSGRLAQADENRVVLYDAARQGREVIIPGDQVDELIKDKKSLMPEGVVKTLSRQEFLDLVRFLTQLGRPGPYATSVTPVIRRWRVQPLAADRTGALQPSAFRNDTDWRRAYSGPRGELPAGEFAQSAGRTLVRGHVDVQQAGNVELRVNSTKHLALWVDESPTPLEPSTTVDLSPGRHAITLVVAAEREQPLALEVHPLPDGAQFQIVAGP